MHRLIAVSAAVLVLMAASIPAPQPALAAEEFDPWNMVFPVDGPHSSSYDNYGACRDGCSRYHEGNDIAADKRTPVVAVGDGVVSWISDPNELASVHIGIDHGNGWYSNYIHLDNDELGTDNGQFYGIAEGIEDGTEVEAGQLIGWVGDSGNAEGTISHLHFELRFGSQWGDDSAVDPNPYLVNAEHNWTGHFRDDDYSVHENNIDLIYLAGITVGCNPPAGNEFCPEDEITRGEMAAFIARALGLSELSGSTPYDDLNGHLFENAVDKIVTAGIGFGCDDDSYCPDEPLLRDEMAELLVRSFGYDNPEGTNFFVDDEGNPFEESIDKLANHSITVGCNPDDGGDHYCPNRTLTRAEMATFFVRAMPELKN